MVLVDDLKQQLDCGESALLVLLYLSAAFDLVDHPILIDCLTSLGYRVLYFSGFHHSYKDGCRKLLQQLE